MKLAGWLCTKKTAPKVDSAPKVESDKKIEGMRREREFQERRASDPMLSYGNKDVRWIVCNANMGPGAEYFTGVEIHAVWNRPEEPDAAWYSNESYRLSTSGPPVKYSCADYRIVAIGLLPDAACNVARDRNKRVLEE